ncbi:unnamed protein product, partial [Prorocentrum cordatum]
GARGRFLETPSTVQGLESTLSIYAAPPCLLHPLLRASPSPPDSPACRRLGAELEAMREGERAPAPAATGHPPAPFAAPRGPDELLEWVAELHGPSETPYAGGVFYLSMSFPEEYPMRPPTVLFLTRCFHPNVDEQSGSICLNILKQEWSPLLTVFSTLLSISALLAEPEPEDPLNKEARGPNKCTIIPKFLEVRSDFLGQRWNHPPARLPRCAERVGGGAGGAVGDRDQKNP